MELSNTKFWNEKAKRILWTVSFSAILAFSFAHLWVILKSAVDIPYWDEWEEFGGNGLVLGWSTDYIFRLHNEHRLALTEIINLINLRLSGLNFSYQIYFNALLYIYLVLLAWQLFVKRFFPPYSFAALAAILPFISTLPIFNHTMAYQNNAHLCLIAFLGGTYLVFKDRWILFLVGLLLWVISIFTLANGISCSAAAAIIACLYFVRCRPPHWPWRLLTLSAFLGGALAFWFQGYRKNPDHPAYTLPWTLPFIRYFEEILSSGFGFTRENVLISTVILLVVLTVIAASLFQAVSKRESKENTIWFPLAVTFGITASLALTAFARGGFPLHQAKASRYAEFSIFLPLLCMALLAFQPRTLSKLGRFAVAILLLFGLYNNFNLSEYKMVRAERLAGKKCVNQIIKASPDNPKGSCPKMYPNDLGDKLLRAKELEINFYKTP